MPLLCISLPLLLLLLLLPLSLSCDSRRPPGEVQNDYMAIVQTHFNNARGSVTALLHNSSCPELKHKLRSCMPDIANVLRTLHNLTCKLKNFQPSQTDGLATSVLNSLRCPCPQRSTKEPAKRRRRNEHNKRKGTIRLCKAKAILHAMTECYEMLNTLLMDTSVH